MVNFAGFFTFMKHIIKNYVVCNGFLVTDLMKYINIEGTQEKVE